MVQDIKGNPKNTRQKWKEEENQKRREAEAKEKALADKRRKEYERMIAQVEKEAPKRNAERADKDYQERCKVKKQQRKTEKNRI